MLGWWIVIAARTAEETEVNSSADTLACWETGLGGTDWLHRLVKVHQAEQLSYNGYPCRFTAKAADVLPLISNGPPAHEGPTVIGDDYVMPGGWSGNVILHHDRIAACPPEQILTIDAWDQS